MGRTMVEILRQQSAARENIASWEREQKAIVEEQAEETNTELTSQISNVEKTAQENLQSMRDSREIAKRASSSSIGKSVDVATPATKAAIAELEQTRKEIVTTGQKSKEEVKKAKEETLKSITETAATAETELATASANAIAEVETASIDNIELDYTDAKGNSEWISREYYNSLSTEQQDYLNKNGLTAFKSKYYTTVGNDELVSNEYYDSLSVEDKTYLTNNGLDSWNNLLLERSYESYVSLRTALGKELQFTLEEWKSANADYRQERLDLNYYLLYRQTSLDGGLEEDDLMTQEEWLSSDSTKRNAAYQESQYYLYTVKAKEANMPVITLENWNTLSDKARSEFYSRTVGLAYYNSVYLPAMVASGETPIDSAQWISMDADKQTELLSNAYYIIYSNSADAGDIPVITFENWNALSDTAKNELLSRTSIISSYNQYVTWANSNNVSTVTLARWQEMTDEERNETISTVSDLANWNAYLNNSTSLGQTPITITEWSALSPEEKIKTLSFTNYQLYGQAIATTGNSAITFNDWQGLTPEEQTSLFSTTISENFIALPDGTLYPNNSYYDKEGNLVTGFNDMPTEFQTVLEDKGFAGLQTYIDNNYITLNNGSIYPLETYTDENGNTVTGFNDLSLDYQVVLTTSGISGLQDKIANDLYNAYVDTTTAVNATLSTAQLTIKTASEWNKMSSEQQQEAYTMVSTKFNEVYTKLNNGEYIATTDYEALTTEQQTLINQLGISDYNAKLQADYIATLPQEAQDYIATVGYDKFQEAFESAKTQSLKGIDVTGNLQVIGLVPSYADTATVSEEGEVSYTGSPNMKDAVIIELDNIDFDNLTEADYYNISYTASQDERYAITPLYGIPYYQSAFDNFVHDADLTAEQKKALKDIGFTARSNQIIDAVSFIVPLASALRSDVTFSNVNTWQNWAVSVASIVSLIANPVAGIGAKALGLGTKAAGLGAKGIQATVLGTYTVVSATEISKMSTNEKILNGTLLVVFAGSLYGKSILKALGVLNSSFAKSVSSSLNQAALGYKQLGVAISSGVTSKVQSAAKNLANIGNTVAKENIVLGRTIKVQANYVSRNAKAIANNKTVLSDINENWLNRTANSISTTVSKIAKGESGEVKIPDRYRTAGAETVQKTKLEDIRIQREAINPTGDIFSGKVSSTLLQQQRIMAREGVYQPKPQLANTSKTVAKPVDTIEIDYNKVLAEQKTKTAFNEVLKSINKTKNDIQTEKLIQNYRNQKEIELKQQKITNEQMAILKKETEAQIVKEAEVIKNWKTVKQNWINETNRITGIRVKNAINKVLEEIKSIELKEAAKLTGDATPTEIATAKAQISATNTERVLAQVQNMKANEAIKYMLRSNMITSAVATNVNAFAKIFEQASNLVQSSVLSRVSSALAKQLRTLANESNSSETKTQAIANAQAIAKAEIQTVTSVLTTAETTTQAIVEQISLAVANSIAKTSTKTELDTKAEIEAKVETATKTITNPELKNQIKNEVQTQVESLVKTKANEETKAETKTEVKTQTETKVSSKIKTVEETKIKETDKIKDIEKLKIYKPITINLPEGKITLTAKQVAGSVGWKQGIMYWILYPPYKKDNYIATRKPIKGIPYSKGIGSAYRTLIRIGGVLPKEIYRDMGIMDIKITTTGKKPTIKFKRDIGQKTTTTGIKVVKGK